MDESRTYTIGEMEEVAVEIAKMVRALSLTAEEAGKCIKEVMDKLPPPGENEIILIKSNPSLNWFQKRKLIKRIRSMMNE